MPLRLVLAALFTLALAAPAAAQEVSPPPRVGRIAWTRGQVSFRPAGGQSWDQAVQNYPLTAGDALWTAAGAEAAAQVSATTVDLAAGTELDVDQLDATQLVGTLPQGEAVLRVGPLLPGESYQLITPRGTVTIATPGRYEIAAGTTDTPTLVNVYQGAAQLSGPSSLTIRAGQSAQITGDQNFAVRLTPALHDAFAERMLPAPRRYGMAAPPIVTAMPGGDDLDEYGTWQSAPNYGAVWYPRVAAGWVPYREGHWAFVAPWGWTWIDSDPWGFAPFHYGRWARIGPRWAWVPGPVVIAAAPLYPVYAPALVAFFTIGGGGFSGGLTAGALIGGSIGWVPLAPYEAYHPCFRASPRYLREVNYRDVRNVTNITNVTTINQITINRFGNRGAATVVPAGALVSSRPVGPLARPASAQLLATARPVFGRAPIPPAASTAGVTRAVARAQQIRPLSPQVARQLPPRLAPVPRRTMPGPARRPTPAGVPAGTILRPGAGPAGRPALTRPGAVPPARQVPGPMPGGIVRPAPHPGAPGLRAPNAALSPRGAPVPPRGAGLAPRPQAAPAARPPAIQTGRPGGFRPTGAAPALRQPGARPPGLTAGKPRPTPLPRVITPMPQRGSQPGFRPVPQPNRAAPSHPPVSAYHPPAPAYHPPASAYHPPVPAYHPPAPAYHPPAPAYHPPAPAYHPPPPAYHPPAPAYRPPPPAYHPPAPAYHPPPPRPAPHPTPPADQRKPA